MDTTLFSLWKSIFTTLASYGNQGTRGMERLSWSEEFMKAQHTLMEMTQKEGLASEIDAMGNLWVTLEGTDKSLPPLYIGSHVDTVPSGGAFDGALGITSALAILIHWKRTGFAPRRTVHAIGFAEEEGTRFGLCCLGSQAISGELKDRDPESIQKGGKSLAQWLREAGLSGNPFQPRLDAKGAFLEFHIEQGGTLEADGLPLGIVSAIVGIDRFIVTVTGQANHAGTTEMKLRHDALAAASDSIVALYKRALAHNRKYVATVGELTVTPGAANVIPGKVVFTLELRSETLATMEAAMAAFRQEMGRVEKTYGVSASIEKLDRIDPVPMNDHLMEIFEKAAEKEQVPYEKMPSWAGHDAMIMGRHLPTAMLFVPSIGGISHSPKESTDDDAIKKALSVLESAMRSLGEGA
jgi:hydantoinase/carbamoylase family amidase